MNRPKRPMPGMQRRRKPQPNRAPARAIGGPRRRSPLDFVPTTGDQKFRVLGTGADRSSLMTYANPMEMLVLHGFTQEIESAFSSFRGRSEDFWEHHPELLEQAYKIDEVLAGVVARKNAPSQT
jgi:hypothetical protein